MENNRRVEDAVDLSGLGGTIPESVHDLSRNERDFLESYRALNADQAERLLWKLCEIIASECKEND